MFEAKERAAAAAILFGYTLMIELKLYTLTHPKINNKLSRKTLKTCYRTMHSRNKAQHKQLYHALGSTQELPRHTNKYWQRRSKLRKSPRRSQTLERHYNACNNLENTRQSSETLAQVENTLTDLETG
jgi:uncharacterized membrane protein YgaE (UPF0421/DUF939 family)